MMQIAICDDSKQDIGKLKSILKEMKDKYSICFSIKEYESGEELLKEPMAFHLIFLDIMMKGKDGIEIGKQIYRKNKTVKIIFQTNFGQYCQEAINKSHAFAFLEKPLQPLAVEEQIKEFLQSSDKMQKLKIEFRNVKYLINGKEITKEVLYLPAENILYFENVKRQKEIKIVTDTRTYLYRESMNELQERAEKLGFEICCRGILVNMERVKRIKGYDVFLDNGDIVPLSQRRVSEFKERLNEYVHGSFKE